MFESRRIAHLFDELFPLAAVLALLYNRREWTKPRFFGFPAREASGLDGVTPPYITENIHPLLVRPRTHMDRNTHLALFVIALAGSLFMFAFSLAPRGRSASRWIRYAMLLLGPVGVTWALVGIYLLLYQRQLTLSTYHFLYTLKIGVGGIAIGILAVLLLSSEFRALSTRKKA